jgi:hypothetical protein
LRLTEWLGLTEAVIRVSEGTDWDGTASGSKWGCVCGLRRLWTARRGLCVARLQSSSGTGASPPVLLDSGDGDPFDRSAVQVTVTLPVLKLPFVCRFTIL